MASVGSAAEREEATRRAERRHKRLLRGRLGRAATDEMLSQSLTAELAEALIRQVCLHVGPIGAQALDDLSRIRLGRQFSGKPGRHHRLEIVTLEHFEHLPDWSAALITIRTYQQFGSRSRLWDGVYRTFGGNQFRVLLAVRDTTTGECHLLTVPPRFGDSATAWHASFDEGWPQYRAQLLRRHSRRRPAAVARLARLDRMPPAHRRVWAAIAWTFGMDVAEYQPQVQA